MRYLLRSLLGMIFLVGCTQDLTATPTPTQTELMGTTTPSPHPPTTLIPVLTPTASLSIDSAAVLELGKGSIWESALSPDQQYLVVVGEAGITLYDVEAQQEAWFQPIEYPDVEFYAGRLGRVMDVGWKSDGQAFSVVYLDSLTTWNAQTGEIIKEDKLPFVVQFAKFSPSSALLAILSETPEGTENTHIWDVEANKELYLLNDTDDYFEMEWASESWIWIAGIGIWNIETGQSIVLTKSFEAGIFYKTSVAFSSDGSKAAAGYVRQREGPELLDSGLSEGAIAVWDAHTGALINEWETTKGIDDIVFSPDGTELGYTSTSPTITFYDIMTAQITRTFEGKGDISLSPDQSLLIATTRDAVTLMNVETGQQLRTVGGYSEWVADVAFSVDGSLIASNSVSRVNLWDGNTGKWLRAFTPSRRDAGISLSADGKLLAIGMAYPEVWNVQTGQRIVVLNNGMRRLYPHSLVAFAPEGHILATTAGNFDEYDYGEVVGTYGDSTYLGDGDRIVIWDAQSGTIIKTLLVRAPVTAMAWSPQGDVIALQWNEPRTGIIAEVNRVGIWDISTGELITTEQIFPEQQFYPSDELAWSPFDTGFIKFDADSIRFWPLERTLAAGRNVMFDSATKMAFAEDGAYLIIAEEKSISVWDSRTGDFVHELEVPLPQRDMILSIAVSPDSRYLLVGTLLTVLRIPLTIQP